MRSKKDAHMDEATEFRSDVDDEIEQTVFNGSVRPVQTLRGSLCQPD